MIAAQRSRNGARKLSRPRASGSFQASIELAADPERVEPERLNFHRLADARRHHPVADLASIQVSCTPGIAGGKQAIVDPCECRSACLGSSR